jgi:riboflavin kinase/FMN adenylyltransferase
LTYGGQQVPIRLPPLRVQVSPVLVRHSLPSEPLALPSSATGGNAVAFGNFDGLHVGHRALLAHLRSEADRLQGDLIVVTFDPHPLQFLHPERAPAAIDSLDGRLTYLAQLGVDQVYVLRFDEAIAAVPAHTFARDWLCGLLRGRAFAVGPDMHFGHKRLGDVNLLRHIAAEFHGTVSVFSGVLWDDSRVSSSRVRHAIREGRVGLAEHLLARPFRLRGTVVHGDARGRTIGFPTANLVAPGQVVPANGIYAGRAGVNGAWHGAAISVGTRPTFAGEDVRVEAYLLDFDGDIYEQPMDLEFVARLRDEAKFADLDALIAQIAADVAATRRVLAERQASGAQL